MSNEYHCCTHNPDVPPYLRCPDMRSKRPSVNVYLDSDEIEKRLDALDESQAKQDTTLEKASSDIEALEKSVAAIEADQKEQNESLYKHGDRLADLENVIKHDVLPYIGDDDDRDDKQEERIAALETAKAEHDDTLAELKASQELQNADLVGIHDALTSTGDMVTEVRDAVTEIRDDLHGVHDELTALGVVDKAQNEQITRLNDYVEAHKKEYEADHLALDLLSNEHANDVKSLVEDITALQDVDTELKSKDAEQDEAITGLRDNATETGNAIIGIRDALTSYGDAITGVRDAITGLRDKDAEQDGRLADLEGASHYDEAINTRVGVLETAAVDAAANFEDIQSVLEAYETRIAELESKVSNLEALFAANS